MSSTLCIIEREACATGNWGTVSSLGDYVKEEMDRQGLTQLELESRSGIPNATLSRILNGSVAEPRPSQIARIAKALDMKFWALMQRAGYTTETPGNPSEEVVRLADVLTARPLLREIVRESELLTPEEHQAVLTYIALLRQHRRPVRARKKTQPVPKGE